MYTSSCSPLKEKSEDFLDELVNQFNLDGIVDKNEVSEKTKDFIDIRLTNIAKELQSIDDKIEKYKLENKFTGIDQEYELLLKDYSENNNRLVSMETQIRLTKWLNF